MLREDQINSHQSTNRRGFASMDEARQKEIASKGGKAAHKSGHAHEFDSEEARIAGRKGGRATHKPRETKFAEKNSSQEGLIEA